MVKFASQQLIVLLLFVSRERDEYETETFTTETRYSKSTGLPLVSFTRLNGLLHATPDDQPSYVLYDELGRPKLMQWHHEDELHRDGAGAMIYIDPETQVHTNEGFYTMGQPRDRSFGPHIVSRDHITGVITELRYAGDEDLQSSLGLQEPP
ncbi:hypothetical protein [Shimia sp. MMG029]|uniref:hypothetical protein n=1 Tax=Shimia sp. MMG029 TaxID=3021978 RepID=UPI0022FE5E06|nr:hypothetical protein [Shimia sp. MMG029]MDA5556048.1 hypothetical protein [Shimia sp. MMG029]